MCDSLFLEQDGKRVMYEQKKSLILLGDFLDADGCSSVSMSYNLGRAESQYYRHQQQLRNRALPLNKRLGAWCSSVAPVASQNAGTWHLTAGLLGQLRTWELQMMRRLLRLRRVPVENFAAYNKRTACMLVRWMADGSRQFLYATVMKAIFKSSWREKMFKLDSGEAPLHQLRSYRSAAWWETWQALATPAKRRQLCIQHGARGHPRRPWEHPFVCVWGVHWRTELDGCCTCSEWMAKFPSFSAKLCAAWHLPPVLQG